MSSFYLFLSDHDTDWKFLLLTLTLSRRRFCRANQWTGFHMIGTSAMKNLTQQIRFFLRLFHQINIRDKRFQRFECRLSFLFRWSEFVFSWLCIANLVRRSPEETDFDFVMLSLSLFLKIFGILVCWFYI